MTETNPDPKQLRSFALVTSGLLAGIFGLLLPAIWNYAWPVWPWAAGGILAAWGVVAPATLFPFYRYWMKFAAVLGWINTRLLLGFVFYALITPIGFVARLFGRDPMQRKFDEHIASYRAPPLGDNNMEVPY
jgi:hypothetical protein